MRAATYALFYIATALLLALALMFTPAHAQFLTAPGAGFLLDAQGGRLATLTGSKHSVMTLSAWEDDNGVTIRTGSVVASLTPDLTGVAIRGFAWDITGVLSSTLETVDSTGKVVILATCPGQECNFTLLASAMAPLANDVWLVFTITSGARFAATTKISRP